MDPAFRGIGGGGVVTDDDDDDTSDDDAFDQAQEPTTVQDHEDEDGSSASSDKTLAPAIKSKLKDMSVDYARGEGRLQSESSSSEEEDDDSSSSEEEEEDPEGEEEAEEFEWGELDKDADEAAEETKRLAVCNLDWDRVGADDIFVSLSSFCPQGGRVSSVKIYTSEFGKKRLAEEDQFGPEELRKRDEQEAEDEFDALGQPEDQEEVDKRALEKVRRYQANRLK